MEKERRKELETKMKEKVDDYDIHGCDDYDIHHHDFVSVLYDFFDILPFYFLVFAVVCHFFLPPLLPTPPLPSRLISFSLAFSFFN